MPRPKVHDDALRRQLIETAARLLADEGPHALSTRRIAREVGTSTTAIYSLLGSKEQVVRAVYLEGFRRLAERQGTMPRTDDPEADIHAAGLVYFDNGVANPHLYDVMFHRPVREFTPEPEDVALALGTLGTLLDLVRRAIDAGLFSGSPETIGRELWSLAHGVTSLTVAGMLDVDDARARLVHLMQRAVDGYRDEANAVRSSS